MSLATLEVLTAEKYYMDFLACFEYLDFLENRIIYWHWISMLIWGTEFCHAKIFLHSLNRLLQNLWDILPFLNLLGNDHCSLPISNKNLFFFFGDLKTTSLFCSKIRQCIDQFKKCRGKPLKKNSFPSKSCRHYRHYVVLDNWINCFIIYLPFLSSPVAAFFLSLASQKLKGLLPFTSVDKTGQQLIQSINRNREDKCLRK